MSLFSKIWQRKLFMLRRVEGESMSPVLRPGQLVIASAWKQPTLNSIVIADIGGHEVVKRVAGIIDDAIELRGDNQTMSMDSRHYGLVSRRRIIGTVL